MAKINSTKLIPSAKTSSALVVGGTNAPTIKERKAKISSAIKPIDLKTTTLSTGVKGEKDVNNKLVKIEKFFQSDLITSKKEAEKKRKEKEKQDFESAEKKLELPKISGFKLPKFFDIPKLGFLDRVKRFLFFTALGWLFPKIIDFLPKLEGIVTVIGKVAGFAGDIFGKLLNGFTTFVSAGIDLKDKTLGFIAQQQKGDYQKNFDRLEKLFNTFTDASIVAGLLAVDIGAAAIDEINKRKKKQKSGKPGKPSIPEERPRKPPVTTGRGGKKGLGRGVKITEGKGGKPPSSWSKLFKGPFAKLKGPLSRFAGSVVPGLGGVIGAIDAKSRFDSGDRIGGTLASISSALDFGAAGSALTGIGLPVAGVLGTISMSIDVLLLVRDILSLIPFIPKNLLGFSRGGRIVRKYQGGGTTRAGKPVNAPKRRTYTPVKAKPFKFKPSKSQPGKDVGGEGKIKKLYPDTDTKRAAMSVQEWIEADMPGTYSDYLKQQKNNSQEGRPNPYAALTSTSRIFKTLSRESGRIRGVPNSKDAIGYLMNGIGGLMGAAVDASLGQKTDSKIYKSFSSGIGYLVDTLVNRRLNSRISTISGFTDGGKVIPSRELKDTYESLSSGDLISKVIGPSIEQRINEVIQKVQNEVRKKVKEESEAGGGGMVEPGVGMGDDTNAGKVFNALLAEGFTPNQAAGVVGNLMQESGGGTKNLKPTADNGTHYGIAQWDKVDRWPAVSAYIRSIGKNPNSIDGQIVGLIWELKNKEKKAYRELKKAKSAENAAIVWLKEFERSGEVPGQVGFDNRVLYASRISKEFAERGTIGISTRSGNIISIGKMLLSQGFTIGENKYFTKNNWSGAGPNPGGFNPKGNSPVGSHKSRDHATNALDITDWRGSEESGIKRLKALFLNLYSNREKYGIKALIFDPIGYWFSGMGDYSRDAYGGHPNHLHVGFTKSADYALKEGDLTSSPNPPGKQEPQLKPQSRTGTQLAEGLRRQQQQQTQNPLKQFWQNITGTNNKNKTNQRRGIIKYRNQTYFEQNGNYYEEYQPGKIKQIPKEIYNMVPRSQDGGLIGQSKPNRPVPNSFASYETYGSGMMIAIQPIIIEKTVPIQSERMIAFPVAVAVNSSTDNLSLSRG